MKWAVEALASRGGHLASSLLMVVCYEVSQSSWWGYTAREDHVAFFKTLEAHLSFELPAVITLLLLLYTPRARPTWLSLSAPALCVIGLYELFDHFTRSLARSPRVSDLSNAPLLFEVAPREAYGVVALGGLALYLQWILNRSASRHGSRGLLVRLFAVVLICLGLSSHSFKRYHLSRYQYVDWSELTTTRDNGRLSSFLFYTYQEEENLQKLQEYDQADQQLDLSQLYLGAPQESRPNIHVIILESWVDPRLICTRDQTGEARGLSFSRSPLATELVPHLIRLDKVSGGLSSEISKEVSNAWGSLGFSRVRSPVYGGGTAQAEFEMLTGLPALERVNAIEFNVMRGAPASSFIRHLRRYGYHSITTIGAQPSYFNVQKAYQSLGLEDPLYLDDIPSFTTRQGDRYLFDGDLFERHYTRLVSHQERSPHTPVVSYLVGMYGHTPFERNESLRPRKIEVIPHQPTLDRITNLFYYRTQALGRYLSQLQALDPEAIVYVTSDHLPAILNQEICYLGGDPHDNIGLLRYRGQPIDVSGARLYEIPQLIWRLITRPNVGAKSPPSLSPLDTQRDANHMQQGSLESLYYQVLSQSVRGEPQAQ